MSHLRGYIRQACSELAFHVLIAKVIVVIGERPHPLRYLSIVPVTGGGLLRGFHCRCALVATGGVQVTMNAMVCSTESRGLPALRHFDFWSCR